MLLYPDAEVEIEKICLQKCTARIEKKNFLRSNSENKKNFE